MRRSSAEHFGEGSLDLHGAWAILGRLSRNSSGRVRSTEKPCVGPSSGSAILFGIRQLCVWFDGVYLYAGRSRVDIVLREKCLQLVMERARCVGSGRTARFLDGLEWVGSIHVWGAAASLILNLCVGMEVFSAVQYLHMFKTGNAQSGSIAIDQDGPRNAFRFDGAIPVGQCSHTIGSSQAVVWRGR